MKIMQKTAYENVAKKTTAFIPGGSTSSVLGAALPPSSKSQEIKYRNYFLLGNFLFCYFSKFYSRRNCYFSAHVLKTNISKTFSKQVFRIRFDFEGIQIQSF